MTSYTDVGISFFHGVERTPTRLIVLRFVPTELVSTLIPLVTPPPPPPNSVDPLSPPEGAKIGELITFEGVLSAPAPPSSGASRAWSATMEGMKTEEATADGAGVAGWDGRPMLTSAGACTSSIAAGRVR